MTVRPLSAALQKKAEKELNENPERVESDIAALRDWLSKQPHMQLIDPSDQWLLAFLRGSKFSIERCKEKLDMYYTLKGLVPEFFANRDPLGDKIQEILKAGENFYRELLDFGMKSMPRFSQGSTWGSSRTTWRGVLQGWQCRSDTPDISNVRRVFLPLKHCEEEDAARTSIVRLGILNPSEYHLADILKVSFMITEILMIEDDNFTVSGEQVIVDSKDVGVGVLTQWTPALAKKVISCFEKGLPVRMRANHILNTPTGFETAYTIFKAFLGEKLKKRILVHNQDYEALYRIIPKSVLPAEYGGEDGSIQELVDHWKDKVESYRDMFIKEEKVCTDESKRPDKPKTSSEIFGVEGTFRKLDVD